MQAIEEIILGNSLAVKEMKKLIEMVSTSNTTVLIQGETGTGKELVAEAVHVASARKGDNISVNCAAIPSELLESELFGHEKGSFTGAEKTRLGRFEQSNKGTLFLDEIGDYNKKFSKFKSLLAGFPAGTVSGAPKIRAMEIIDELETTRRKVYAGGIGYFSANGEFDTCIALRTAVAKNKKFYVQAGAGIVADSKPINEYEETVNKAKALINALR